MICYRDMTFCTAYAEGKCINSDCHRAFDALDLSMAKKWWGGLAGGDMSLSGPPPIAWSDFWDRCDTRIEA